MFGVNTWGHREMTPETPMQLLSRNISVEIEQQKTKKLIYGGLRIHIQKSFENRLLQQGKSSKKLADNKSNPFAKKPSSKPARTNDYPGKKLDIADLSQYDELPFTAREIFRGTRPVPLIVLQSQLEKQQQRRAGQLRRRVYQGPVMTKAQYLAKRRSIQFHIKGGMPRKSQLDRVQSKDSVDSLQTVLGSIQEEQHRRHLKKDGRKSQLLQQGDLNIPLGHTQEEEDDDEDEDYVEEDAKSASNDALDARKSGKIRFEIPAPSESNKDPGIKEKIRERRPTSVRTTRFTLPETDDDNEEKNPHVGLKIKTRRPTSAHTKTPKQHAPHFAALSVNVPRDNHETVKIQERTQMDTFMNTAAGQRREPLPLPTTEEKGQKLPLLTKGTPLPKTPHVGVHISIAGFPGMFGGKLSKKIQQRSKTPELNEGAQKFKKLGIPLANNRRHHQAAVTGSEVLERGSKADLASMKILEDEEEDPVPGLMRIRKRRNIGRVLTPPFSRNERSNSLAVLDMKSSMFSKRNKVRGQSTGRRSLTENKRQIISLLNKQMKDLAEGGDGLVNLDNAHE